MATVAEAYLSVIRSEKNSDQKMANKQPKVYILDTSVAGLILDGELWSRESGLLVRYHTDLQATVTPRFKTDPRRLGRDVIYSTAGNECMEMDSEHHSNTGKHWYQVVCDAHSTK